MQKKILFGLGFLAVLAACWSLLHPSFFYLHDYVHATRIAEMLRALQDGQFPVRWSRNLGFGYGMPLFEFYAPLPYYIGAAFYWLGVDVVSTIKLLYLLCTLGTFVGMYQAGKRLFGRTGGVLAATALTLAPYRAVNLYVRGAVSEAWAIMALPWVLLGIIQVVKREKYGWLTLLAGLVMLFLSHNITTMLFVPISLVFAAGYLLMNVDRKNVRAMVKPVLQLAGSYSLAIGLVAFYLFPAFLEKDYTQINRIFGGYFSYYLHFLYIRQFITPFWGYGGSEWGPNDGISFFLGGGQLLGLVASGVLLVTSVVQTKKFWDKKVWLFGLSFVLMCVALFMSLEKSKFIWDSLPMLQVAQFPWRWLSVAITMLSLLLPVGLFTLKTQMQRYIYAGVLIAAIILSNFYFFRPESFLKEPDNYYYTDSQRIQTNMSEILPDYIPKQMAQKLTPPKTLFLVPGGTESHVDTLIDKSQEKLFKTTFISPVFLNVMIADFPGWKIEIDGKEVEKRTGEMGTFGAEVPAGEHLVGVYFGETPVRQWSDIASGISLLVLLFLVLPKNLQKNHAEKKSIH
jgi:hypothetical protein